MMRKRNALSLAVAAVLGALAIAALPALAGAKGDHGDRHGDHRGGERHQGDHHGSFDRDEDAGTIGDFDATSGKLTIALTGGDSVSGLVTSRTDVRCGSGDESSARLSRDSGSSGRDSGDDSSGDDSSGRGEPELGDDHGEAAEPGDDNGGRGEPEPGDDRGDHGNGPICSTDDLTVGAVVHEADLDLKNGVARFDEIELA